MGENKTDLEHVLSRFLRELQRKKRARTNYMKKKMKSCRNDLYHSMTTPRPPGVRRANDNEEQNVLHLTSLYNAAPIVLE
jgi:hypothetical protein